PADPRRAALGGRPAHRGGERAGRSITWGDRRDPAHPGGPGRPGPRRDAPPPGGGRRSPRRTPAHRPATVHGDGLGAAEGAGMSEPTTEDISVLLVDDQDLFREGVRVIVDAQEGMSVVGTAADGLEAVQQVDELEPDVVLMDI